MIESLFNVWFISRLSHFVCYRRKKQQLNRRRNSMHWHRVMERPVQLICEWYIIVFYDVFLNIHQMWALFHSDFHFWLYWRMLCFMIVGPHSVENGYWGIFSTSLLLRLRISWVPPLDSSLNRCCWCENIDWRSWREKSKRGKSSFCLEFHSNMWRKSMQTFQGKRWRWEKVIRSIRNLSASNSLKFLCVFIRESIEWINHSLLLQFA